LPAKNTNQFTKSGRLGEQSQVIGPGVPVIKVGAYIGGVVSVGFDSV